VPGGEEGVGVDVDADADADSAPLVDLDFE